jgi:hypothetical protein
LPDAKQLRHVDAAVDPGNEKLPGTLFGQQVEALRQARAATGQHDDGVGLTPRVAGLVRQHRCKPQEANDPQYEQHEGDWHQEAQGDPASSSAHQHVRGLLSGN